MANTHTLVKGNKFVSFIPQGATTQIRTFRGYDIEEVVTLGTPNARRRYSLLRADGFVNAAANTQHDAIGGMLYEGRY